MGRSKGMERRTRPSRGARRRWRGTFEALEGRALLAGTGLPPAGGGPLPTSPGALSGKLGNVLTAVYFDYLSQTRSTGMGAPGGGGPAYHVSPKVPNAPGLQVSGGRVVLDAVAPAGKVDALRSELTGLGATVIGQFAQVVGVLMPVANLAALARVPDLRFAAPSYKPTLNAVTTVGAVDDQAVQSLRTDVARARYGVDGTGVTVGILSDSFDSTGGYSADVATGDLPANITVLSDLPAGQGTDEGRAMAQLVYKIAPGAKLAFATAFSDITAFANGILNLAKPVAQGGAGAKVIVDDVGYENEPIFQDGLVAQAVNQAVAKYGASYFSAAGNAGRLGYEAPFNPVTEATAPAPGLGTGTFHNFQTAAGQPADVFQPISILAGYSLDLTFQWDQPFASQSTAAPGTSGAKSEVDVYLLDSTKHTVVASSTTATVGGDPYQNIIYQDPGDPLSGTPNQYYLVFKLAAGPAPTDMKYIELGAGGGTATIDNYTTDSGTTFGHAQAAGAAGVGAAQYDQTPAFSVSPAQLEFYSSSGGTPVLLDTAGNRLATPDLREQPRFVAVDGSDNTFLGGQDLDGNNLPNFSGTSAAAPHAAAVAALMLQENPRLSTARVYSILQATAIPMPAAPTDPPGYSFDTGFGLIQADRALAKAAGITLAGQVYTDANGNGVHDQGESGVSGATVFLDSNGNGVLDSGTTTTPAGPSVVVPADTNLSNGPTRVTSPITLSGLPGRVTKVTVNIDISETEDSSLGVALISPSGIRIPLIENAGLGLTNFTNVTFDDAGTTSAQDPTIFDYTGGTFVPDVLLAAMIGENPNGTWKLEARDFGTKDASNNPAQATVNSWSMTLSYAEPSTTTDANGYYRITSPFTDAAGGTITGLAPSAYFGAYDVRVVVPPSSKLTQPTSPYNLTLAFGQVSSANNFGFAPSAARSANLPAPPDRKFSSAPLSSPAVGFIGLPVASPTPAVPSSPGRSPTSPTVVTAGSLGRPPVVTMTAEPSDGPDTPSATGLLTARPRPKGSVLQSFRVLQGTGTP